MKEAKCVIWDLDDTLWDGTLLEGGDIRLKEGIRDILSGLDARGILLSIASRNEHAHAMAKLREFGIGELFLFPQINWNPKSHSVGLIQQQLSLGPDTLIFIDDQPFERAEVSASHPMVHCMEAAAYPGLLSDKRLQPRFITEDSRRRRKMYQEEQARIAEETSFTGPKEQFLSGLGMELIISRAKEEDLQRAEELTIRTNQFNATGKTYSFQELDTLRISPRHELLVCELNDRFGSYGKIGLVLVEKFTTCWHLRMMLMSCRVISRGIGTVMLNYIIREAGRNKVTVRADFKMTDRNRIMYMTYKFANFSELSNTDGEVLFSNDGSRPPKLPDYIRINEI